MRRIILLALPQEAPSLAQQSNVFVAGVGKVNAAIVTTRLILEHRPREVINFGTAGGITVTSGLHRCTRFLQRDMNCQALGFEPGQIPFDDLSEIKFSDDGLLCGTGDSFVNGEPLLTPVDVVDMEAYAMARACWYLGVDFQCWKYISDNANYQASQDWQHKVNTGEKHYLDKLSEIQ
jgi:adenosylhomocysteine nucleosidase